MTNRSNKSFKISASDMSTVPNISLPNNNEELRQILIDINNIRYRCEQEQVTGASASAALSTSGPSASQIQLDQSVINSVYSSNEKNNETIISNFHSRTKNNVFFEKPGVINFVNIDQDVVNGGGTKIKIVENLASNLNTNSNNLNSNDNSSNNNDKKQDFNLVRIDKDFFDAGQTDSSGNITIIQNVPLLIINHTCCDIENCKLKKDLLVEVNNNNNSDNNNSSEKTIPDISNEELNNSNDQSLLNVDLSNQLQIEIEEEDQANRALTLNEFNNLNEITEQPEDEESLEARQNEKDEEEEDQTLKIDVDDKVNIDIDLSALEPSQSLDSTNSSDSSQQVCTVVFEEETRKGPAKAIGDGDEESQHMGFEPDGPTSTLNYDQQEKRQAEDGNFPDTNRTSTRQDGIDKSIKDDDGDDSILSKKKDNLEKIKDIINDLIEQNTRRSESINESKKVSDLDDMFKKLKLPSLDTTDSSADSSDVNFAKKSKAKINENKSKRTEELGKPVWVLTRVTKHITRTITQEKIPC